MSAKPHVIIYTDGACKGNPGVGGWGAVLIWQGQEKELYGYDPETTNNRMELMAVIQALAALKKPCKIDLFTDSTYVLKGATEWLALWKRTGWKKGTVKNRDLWEQLDLLLSKHHISFKWVRGHSGDPLNERVDGLANKAIEENNGDTSPDAH
ncbi:MAG: ribonuclease HI [Proteobacteria bacterium]|nr:ribonuclease HI [Pseudomonadota bacterium]